MGEEKSAPTAPKKYSLHFYILIFFVGMLFTGGLWDAYYNGDRPLDRDLASILILIMGTLFSVAAALLSWSIETRRDYLQKEVDHRTEELEEKNKELLHRNQEVENFIHIISHDLKAPIVSIQGFASIIRDELGEKLQGSVLDYFNRIQTNARRMNGLILDLLEFSRVGRVEEEKESLDTEQLLREIIAELRPEIDKRHIQVTLSDHFPPLWGSRKRLSQVFTNLVQNAVKYIGTPEEPRIEISCHEDDGNGRCTLWVKDNGLGIKREFHEKIFQIFQRAPSAQKIEGSGIGLSIVKKIVEHNGGKTWVESEEGKGSQFFVSWPKAEGHEMKQKVAA
ncbi:MAG: hypothetical protein A3G87_01395 [Omnitrophica bacterium RIFCSPLOWO2_12_FULL_50_11]|nr:MAG: hypothetical protein A3G87_01395 [Omnitrophica bacterium RIFCSPLOWO2_12_FULL_50_11]